MRKTAIVIVGTAVMLVLASCVSVKSPVGGRVDTTRFAHVSEDIDGTAVAAGYHDVTYFMRTKAKGSIEVMPGGSFNALPFDGEFVYLPFYVIQRVSSKSRDQYREPEHTIIGTHFLGVSMKDSSVVHGPGKLISPQAFYFGGYGPTGHFVKNYGTPLTKRTSLRQNEHILYHPDSDEIPLLPELLPSMGRVSRLDTIPMQVLELKQDGTKGYHYEAVNIEHGLFVGFDFDKNGWGEFLIIGFDTPADLVRHLRGELKNRAGYDIITGYNDAGYTASGEDRNGERFLGRINARGPEGKGTYVFADGSRRYGTYSAGEVSGPAITFLPDGAREYAVYERGEPVTDLLHRSPEGELRWKDASTGEILGPYEQKHEFLGDEWVYFEGEYETPGISIDGESILHSITLDEEGENSVTMSSANGSFVKGPMESGRVRRGSLAMRDGRNYRGELYGFTPYGIGIMDLPDGKTLMGVFDGSSKPITVQQSFLKFEIAFPVAREIEVVGNFPLQESIQLEKEANLWTGSVQVDPRRVISYSILVNGNEVDDELLYPAASETESFVGQMDLQEFRESGFVSRTAALSLSDETVEAVPEQQEGEDESVEREQKVKEYVESIEATTEAYKERAKAVRKQLEYERNTAIAGVVAVTADVLESEGYLDTSDSPMLAAMLDDVRERAAEGDFYQDFRYQFQLQQALSEGDYRRAKDIQIERLAQNPRYAELAEFLDTVSDVAFDSYEAALAQQRALEKSQTAGSTSRGGVVAGGNIKNPAWTDKPSPPPSHVQLHSLVQAADHYYNRYAQAARSGEGSDAEQLYKGHVASVQRAEALAEQYERNPGPAFEG